MKIVDDRTADQKRTHTLGVVGTDKFLSGWGEAIGGVSYAAWACRPEKVDQVYQRIEAREDMKRVRTVRLNGYRPRGTGHLHIYVIKED